MTAEVAILNRTGVALAADSAVTVTQGDQQQKIWTSADKLFQLSEVDPVGVMFHGNAEFATHQWETIIKAYRRELGTQRFPTVDAHAHRFFRFLTGNLELFPRSRQKEHSMQSYKLAIASIMREAGIAIDKHIQQHGPLSTQDLPHAFAKAVEQIRDAIRNNETLSSIPSGLRARLRKSLSVRIRKAIEVFIGELPLNPYGRRLLLQSTFECLFRACFSEAHTGIVFAGFGDRQNLPALVWFKVEGLVEGAPRYHRHHRVDMSENRTRSYILPLAQQDSLHSFIGGIDLELRDALQDATALTINGLADVLESHLPTDDPRAQQIVAALRTHTSAIQSKLFDVWETIRKNYSQPVVSNLGLSPKDEMASVAEALVNLTKFRRRVSMDQETVGGPIDVAIITRGDGFVWIKRKHYFDPHLNLRILGRYLSRT